MADELIKAQRESSLKPLCSNCAYSVHVRAPGQSKTNNIECRRYPPTENGFPYVKPEECCGEHSSCQMGQIIYTQSVAAGGQMIPQMIGRGIPMMDRGVKDA